MLWVELCLASDGQSVLLTISQQSFSFVEPRFWGSLDAVPRFVVKWSPVKLRLQVTVTMLVYRVGRIRQLFKYNRNIILHAIKF